MTPASSSVPCLKISTLEEGGSTFDQLGDCITPGWDNMGQPRSNCWLYDDGHHQLLLPSEPADLAGLKVLVDVKGAFWSPYGEFLTGKGVAGDGLAGSGARTKMPCPTPADDHEGTEECLPSSAQMCGVILRKELSQD